MTPEILLLAGTVVSSIAGVGGTWLLIRQQGRQTRTTDSQQIIDQLQEERKSDGERHQAEISQVRDELAELRRRVVRMENRELAFFDYIQQLRWHIDQRKDPPPPPWPAALMQHFQPHAGTD